MEGELAALLAQRRAPTVAIDRERLRRERHARLQAELARHSVDVALLLHGPHVAYATGYAVPAVDVTHAAFGRPVAVVTAGFSEPFVVEGAWPELDEGAAALAPFVRGAERVAVDEIPGALRRTGLLDGVQVVEASTVLAPAKLLKTADELGCIAEAQRRNEDAMARTFPVLAPGVTRAEVAGEFLAQLAGLGAANLIDPIFQAMPRTIAAGPRTTTGGVAFPVGGPGGRFAEGDLVWVDSGIDHGGYASDFGRTWIVGREPSRAERQLGERWCAVMLAVLEALRPGATAGDLRRAAIAAAGGTRPWLPHFYLAHGLGVESAEMPLVGTDLGEPFDDALVLAPGMVLVLEPVIWEDGVGGFRAEEIVAVTDAGWCHLGGGHPLWT